MFPHEIEIRVRRRVDKLMRALDGVELSRDLLAVWGVIVVTTLLQLWWFRRKNWV